MSEFLTEMRRFARDLERIPGKFQLAEAYKLIVWVYACTYSIADALSGIPIVLSEKKGSRKVEISNPEHPALALIKNNTAGHLTSRSLVHALLVQLGIFGKCGLALEKFQGGVPTILRFCEGFRLQAILVKNQMMGWNYTTPSEKKVYTEKQMAFFRYYDPEKEWEGLPPYKIARLSIEEEYYIARWNANFFKRGMRPPILLSTDQIFSKPQRDEILGSIRKQYSGVDKGQDALMVEGGLKATPLISSSSKDVDFQEGKEFSREEICAAYGVPPAVVGIFRYANYANSREQKKMFWENCLIPRMVDLEEVFQARIFEPYFSGVEFSFDRRQIPILKLEPMDQANAAKVYYDIGYSREELALILHDPNLRGMAKEASHQEELGQPSASKKVLVEEDFLESVRVLDEGFSEVTYKASFEERYQADYMLHVIIPMQDRWMGFFRHFVGSILSSVVSDYEKTGVITFPDTLHWLDVWNDLSRSLVEGNWYKGADVAEREVKKIGKMHFTYGIKADLSLLEEAVQREIDSIVNKFKYGPRGILDRLGSFLRENQGQVSSVAGLRDLIREAYPQNTDSYTLMLSRTISGTAYNSGRYFTFRERGIEKHKWVNAGDSRVRPTHRLEGGHIITLGEVFPVTKLRWPHDPQGSFAEIVNCRCTTVPITFRTPLGRVEVVAPTTPAPVGKLSSFIPSGFHRMPQWVEVSRVLEEEIGKRFKVLCAKGNFYPSRMASDVLKGSQWNDAAVTIKNQALDITQKRTRAFVEMLDRMSPEVERVFASKAVGTLDVFTTYDKMNHPRAAGLYTFNVRRIALSPDIFDNPERKLRFGKLADEVFSHEVGHAANEFLMATAARQKKVDWYSMNWVVPGSWTNTTSPQRLADDKHFPSWYAKTDHLEDFAETFAMWDVAKSKFDTFYSTPGKTKRLGLWVDLMKALYGPSWEGKW